MFTRLFGNTVLVSYQPTCENLVADFAERIAPHLPSGVKLHSLKPMKLRLRRQNGLPVIMRRKFEVN